MDRTALAHELSKAIKTHFSRSQSAAARSWRIDQSTLSRLISRKRAQLTPRVVTRLLDVLPEDSGMAVGASLLTPSALDALAAHRRWLEMRELWLRYTFHRREGRAKGGRISVTLSHSSDRTQERNDLLAEMAALCPAQVRKFLRRVTKRGLADSPRLALALNNVIAPLTEAVVAGSIERRASELTREEFIQFVEAGLAREEILLSRSPDAIRAQEVSEAGFATVRLDAVFDPRSRVVHRLPNLTEALLDSVDPMLASLGF